MFFTITWSAIAFWKEKARSAKKTGVEGPVKKGIEKPVQGL
jgi:hypothetical protein